ncbi:hypothetical protein GVAV_002808 [Gurleya vavrai]
MVLDAKTDEVLLSSLEYLLYVNFDYRILLKDIKSITNFNSEKIMFLEEKVNFKNSFLDVSNLYQNEISDNYTFESNSIYHNLKFINKRKINTFTDGFFIKNYVNSPNLYCYVFQLEILLNLFNFSIYYADYDNEDIVDKYYYLKRIIITYEIKNNLKFKFGYDLILKSNNIDGVLSLPKIKIQNFVVYFENYNYKEFYEFFEFFVRVLSDNFLKYNEAMPMLRIFNRYADVCCENSLTGIKISDNISYFEFVSSIKNLEFPLLKSEDCQIFIYDVDYDKCLINYENNVVYFGNIGIKNLTKIDKLVILLSPNQRYLIIFKHKFNQENFFTYCIFPKEEFFYNQFLKIFKNHSLYIDFFIEEIFESSNFQNYNIEIFKSAAKYVLNKFKDHEKFLICTQNDCKLTKFKFFVLVSFINQLNCSNLYEDDPFFKNTIRELNTIYLQYFQDKLGFNFKQNLINLYEKIKIKQRKLFISFIDFNNILEKILETIEKKFFTEYPNAKNHNKYIKLNDHKIYFNLHKKINTE